MEYVAKVEEDIKNSLVSLAKAGSFVKMLKLLHYFPEFASCSRPDSKSGYTLLHHRDWHAAYANASAEVIKSLVLLGASLCAVTSKGETPAQVGLPHGMSEEMARKIAVTRF